MDLIVGGIVVNGLSAHLANVEFDQLKNDLNGIKCKVSFFRGRKFYLNNPQENLSFNQLVKTVHQRMLKMPYVSNDSRKTINMLVNGIEKKGKLTLRDAKFYVRHFTWLKSFFTRWQRSAQMHYFKHIPIESKPAKTANGENGTTAQPLQQQAKRAAKRPFFSFLKPKQKKSVQTPAQPLYQDQQQHQGTPYAFVPANAKEEVIPSAQLAKSAESYPPVNFREKFNKRGFEMGYQTYMSKLDPQLKWLFGAFNSNDVISTIKNHLDKQCLLNNATEMRFIENGPNECMLYFKIPNPHAALQVNYPASGERNDKFLYFKSAPLKLNDGMTVGENLAMHIDTLEQSVAIWKQTIEAFAKLAQQDIPLFFNNLPIAQSYNTFAFTHAAFNIEFFFDATKKLCFSLNDIGFNFTTSSIFLAASQYMLSRNYVSRNHNAGTVDKIWVSMQKFIGRDPKFIHFLNWDVGAKVTGMGFNSNTYSYNDSYNDSVEDILKMFGGIFSGTRFNTGFYRNPRNRGMPNFGSFGFEGANSANPSGYTFNNEKPKEVDISADLKKIDTLLKLEGENSITHVFGFKDKAKLTDKLKECRRKGSLQLHPDKAARLNKTQEEMQSVMQEFNSALDTVSKYIENMK